MSVELGHAGMDDSIRVQVGDVMPECQLPLRADGTVEHGGYFLDPVWLDLVLGVDVSPWHERAIIDACRVDEPGEGDVNRQLWVWSILTRQTIPAISLALFVRPGQIRLPEVRWHMLYDTDPLCLDCAGDICGKAMQACIHQIEHPGEWMMANVILVGRDHKVLGINSLPLHEDLAVVWQNQLANAIARKTMPDMPCAELPDLELWAYPAGYHEVMGQQELEQHLVAEGWKESPQQRARRRRRAGR